MRDPRRIDPILEAVRQAWLADPDQRLGQLIYNAVQAASPDSTIPPNPPLFFIEDEDLVAGLTPSSRPA